MMLKRDPSQLFVGDKRGHTPFAYARREHWSAWRKFLHDRMDVIVESMKMDGIMDNFGQEPN